MGVIISFPGLQVVLIPVLLKFIQKLNVSLVEHHRVFPMLIRCLPISILVHLSIDCIDGFGMSSIEQRIAYRYFPTTPLVIRRENFERFLIPLWSIRQSAEQLFSR